VGELSETARAAPRHTNTVQTIPVKVFISFTSENWLSDRNPASRSRAGYYGVEGA
jgi:hypothetical protein